MRIVGTALVAGTIFVFSLLNGGEWIRAGTDKSVERRDASAHVSRQVSFRYQRFRDVVGLKVENVDGQKIGTISDLIVNPESGQPSYVIVKTGGSLLTRRKLVPVPRSAIAMTTAKVGIAAIDISKQRWTHAPEFVRRDLPTLTQSDKARQIAHFFARGESVTPMIQTNGRTGQIRSTGREMISSTATARHNSSCQLATDLIGKQVVAQQGARIGEVADLILDFTGNKPMLAIISADAISRTKANFAVPLELLTQTSDQHLSVRARRANFDQAKQFNPENSGAIAKGDNREIFRYER